MFFLFPYRTDAPVYHFPWATIALVAGCVGATIAMFSGAFDPDDWILDYRTIAPLQWVTSNFLHADWSHLISNMVFLWVFGLIVEGKVGWLRFLAICLTIGVVQCAIEQTLFFQLATDGGSLGASSVIFGLLAISLVWAPLNDVTWMFVFFRYGNTFEVKVRSVAFAFTALQFFWMGLGAMLGAGFGPSSELLHLMGAAIGLPIGVIMLKKGWVDCEEWDWFSVRKGLHLKKAEFAHRRRFAPEIEVDKRMTMT